MHQVDPHFENSLTKLLLTLLLNY